MTTAKPKRIRNVSGYALEVPAYGVRAEPGETVEVATTGQADDLLKQTANWATPEGE